MKSIVPLYFVPAHEAATGTRPADVSLSGEDPNAVLITEENYDDLCEQGLDQLGRMTMWIMNSEREADVAADTVSSQGGSALSAETPLGEGVVLIVDEDVDADGIDVLDKRTGANEAVDGSWELKEKITLAHLSQIENIPDTKTRAMAQRLATSLAGTDPDIIRELQVQLEYHPGAYVGFVSRCVDDMSEMLTEFGIEVTGANMDEIQAQMLDASRKADYTTAQEAVEEAIYSRFERAFSPEENQAPPVP